MRAEIDKGEFGRRVRERRLALGLSQPTVARAAGMSQQAIHHIEHGDVGRPRRMIELADALRTTQEYLLWGHGPAAVAPEPNATEKMLNVFQGLDADQRSFWLDQIRKATEGARKEREG